MDDAAASPRTSTLPAAEPRDTSTGTVSGSDRASAPPGAAATSPGRAAAPATPGRFALHRGDAIDFLRGLPDGCVDLIVTDPAYESLEKHRAIGTTTRLKRSKGSSNEWFRAIFPNARFPELLTEAHRVLREDAHFYLFCDFETSLVVARVNESLVRDPRRGGLFKLWKGLVWDKLAIGMGYHYRSQHELILFFEKGKRKLADLGVSDVIREKRIVGGYPTEKPVRVSEVLVRQSSLPGELVCDPFMGSGSVGEAAVRLGRDFLGNDLAELAVTTTEGRLRVAGATPTDALPLRGPTQLGLGIENDTKPTSDADD
jgi:site-specific DNA-methyltransferase (adenine-specific)